MPASITPQAEPMPPRIAAAKALMPNNVPMSECTENSGAISMPARPASAVDRGYGEAMALRTLLPMGRAGRVLHHGEQRLAPCRVLEGELQREGDAGPDQRDHDLQREDAGAKDLDRLLRQGGRKAARLL